MNTLRKTKRMRKHTLALLTVMFMLMATLLTACGSNQAAAPSTETETTKVETAKAEETESVAPVETEEIVESTAEETTPTPEPVVYEGIDMESTLPGTEWIKTFDGVIEEPKMVIFNDETNKKVIVENGQKVEFSEGDNLLIYTPAKMQVYIESAQNDYETFDEVTGYENYYMLSKLSVEVHDGDEVALEYNIKGEGEYTLDITLIAKKSK